MTDLMPSTQWQAEVDQLHAAERTIEAGLATFVDVGQALAGIRDQRLYRLDGFDTFEGYCQERWGFSRVRAHQMIEAAQVSEALTMVNAPQVTSERQAREVAAIIKADGPERAAEILTEVAAEGKVTAAAIREAARPTKTVTVVEEITVDAETGEIVEPTPAPATTPPRPHRRPLGDAMRDATHDLIKTAERVERLTQDDRWKRNAQQIGDLARRDLLRAQEVLDRALQACN
jgi:hypothetical protein